MTSAVGGMLVGPTRAREVRQIVDDTLMGRDVQHSSAAQTPEPLTQPDETRQSIAHQGRDLPPRLEAVRYRPSCKRRNTARRDAQHTRSL